MVVGPWHGGLPPAYGEAYGVAENDVPVSDRYSVNVGCIDRVGPLRADDASDPAEQR
jgi:hypothetical protein